MVSMSEENRGFVDDLWKQAIPVGTLYAEPHRLFEYDWNFSNLQDAFKEGGVLHGEEKVFVFGRVQRITLPVVGQRGLEKDTFVPVIIVVVSPFPPDNKIGIITADSEEIIDMENVNMGWVPYVPQGELERGSYLERPLPQIYIISCAERECPKLSELYPSFLDCIPYVDNPYNPDETEKNTVVDIAYPAKDGTIVRTFFNWKYDTPERFTDRFIKRRVLSRDDEDVCKEFVREKVRERKRANCEARGEVYDEMEELRRTEERVAKFEKMRFYKFYPVASPVTDAPRFQRLKGAFINMYYGRAHQVF